MSLPAHLPESSDRATKRAPIFLQAWLSWNRRLAALLGLLGVILIAILGDAAVASRIANATLIAIAIAVITASIETLGAPQGRPLGNRLASKPQPLQSWLFSVLVVVVLSGLAAQTWFHASTVIASGDVAPPAGTAWIARLFTAWTWSGSNLGGPSALETQLPWAVVLGSIHALGGSAELAQRVWYTTLFVGAALSSLTFLSMLRLRPIGSTVGAIAYVFSPFVVANVVPNHVYLATLALLPAVPAAVLAAAQGRLRIRTGVVLLAASAPMLGYVYQNPPLAGMVLAATLCTPLVAGWLDGRSAARRGALVLALGLPLLLAVSAFWIVPAALQLPSVNPALAPISSWSWTEGRATVSNALWLNTAWGWPFPEYVPFSSIYDSFPLSFLRFGPAILAFMALIVAPNPTTIRDGVIGSRHLRLAVIAFVIALALIFLSTGTNPPGSVLFDPIYSLPFGWLLREPGRFLFAADLMYAILIALTVEALLKFTPRFSQRNNGRQPAVAAVSAAALALLVILPGLPLLTGAVVPDNRPLLPSAHVKFPGYWTEMAAFVDRVSVPGAVLVLPPDDFYQMPYRWGYYGNDSFIGDLMSRPVLTPSSQSYLSAGPQLLNVVNLTAQTILAENWLEVDRLVAVLGTPLVLVRGDLDTTYPGRAFQPPSSLAAALGRSPDFQLIHTSGPLQLFSHRGASVQQPDASPFYATVNTTAPDLRVMALLPDHAALVSGSPQVGVPSVLELPSLEDWRWASDRLIWSLTEPAAWSFAVAQLDAHAKLLGILEKGSNISLPDGTTISRSFNGGSGDELAISVPAKNDLVDGAFGRGLWAPVGDCANFGSTPPPDLEATVLQTGGPNGGPFLRLSARAHSACEVQRLSWNGGPLLLTLSFRHVSGASPRMCLWERGPERCSALSVPIADSNTWTTYKVSTTPDPGTSALDLYLYSDVYQANTFTQNDYADVRAVEPPSLHRFDLIGTSVQDSRAPSLLVDRNGYSPYWQGRAGSRHVLVDGLLNGWVLSQSQTFSVRYLGGEYVRAAFFVALIGLAVTLGLVTSAIPWRKIFVKRGRGRSGDFSSMEKPGPNH